jgi:hypothetical protein
MIASQSSLSYLRPPRGCVLPLDCTESLVERPGCYAVGDCPEAPTGHAARLRIGGVVCLPASAGCNSPGRFIANWLAGIRVIRASGIRVVRVR